MIRLTAIHGHMGMQRAACLLLNDSDIVKSSAKKSPVSTRAFFLFMLAKLVVLLAQRPIHDGAKTSINLAPYGRLAITHSQMRSLILKRQQSQQHLIPLRLHLNNIAIPQFIFHPLSKAPDQLRIQ